MLLRREEVDDGSDGRSGRRVAAGVEMVFRAERRSKLPAYA